jgi:2-oxoglutarate ferredoxin oxidoreductase subunit alpha
MNGDVSIRIGGKAGQGMQAVSGTLGKIFARRGCHVFIHQDFESRIRGGHNFAQVRIRTVPVRAPGDRVNLLVALDRETIDKDLPALGEEGVLVYDGEKSGFRSSNPRHVSVPLERLAREAGGSPVMMNSVATGAALALMGQDLDPLLGHLEEEFGAKGKDVVEKNQASARAGYQAAGRSCRLEEACKICPEKSARERLLLTGSQAMALGALAAGLRFYAGYPMSPSTPIMEYIASKQEEFGIVVEPAEDEIAAVNMAIGASFAGVRAMTATSGGGFSLMVEALGLAGMTETPLVVVVAQRGGPSTGLPTRTEQADLKFVMHASQGEFPRVVLAPGDSEQAFYCMMKAFNLADRFQVPVIVLGDQLLNDSSFTLDGLEPARVGIERGEMIWQDLAGAPETHKRYAITPTGVSPRIVPGLCRSVQYACSDEHNEEGHITEDAAIRRAMFEKRMRKLEGIRREIAAPASAGREPCKVVLLGWGSTLGVLEEASDRLSREGVPCGFLHFPEVFPFPAFDSSAVLGPKTKIIAVENNYSGQFADVFRAETGLPVFGKVLKYDGRPFSPGEVVDRVLQSL